MKFILLSSLAMAVLGGFALLTVTSVAVEQLPEEPLKRTSMTTTEAEAETTQPKKKKTKDKAKRIKVADGDTLASIAEDHDVSYERLFSANEQIEHPDLIKPGDEIYIPAEDEEFEPREIPGPLVEEEPEQEEKSEEPESTPEPSSAPSGSVWDQLAQCESGGRWSLDSTYDGGLQFHPDTWNRNKPAGYPDYAWQATREQQIEVGKRLQAAAGWGQWPHCASKLGLL